MLTTLCAWGGDAAFLACVPYEQVGLCRAGWYPRSWSYYRLDIKPFTPHPRPFRKLDEKGSLHWDRITRLEKGKIYRQVRAIYLGGSST